MAVPLDGFFPLYSFHFTSLSPCPYLEGRMERKIVIELNGPDPITTHEYLSHSGFRRSHAMAYIPACPNCGACTPVRIKTNEFELSKNLKRIWLRNSDIYAQVCPRKATIEQYRLFTEYQDGRHSCSDMGMMSFYDYKQMLEDSPIDTRIVEFRDSDGELIAACITDFISDGLSAVYSFYETAMNKRSLGTFMVLWLTMKAKAMRLPYVYLGYWVKGSEKMDYKSRFRPLEYYMPKKGWQNLEL